MVNSTVGVLIIHGFTSTTASMEPVARAVRDAGFTSEMPLLPGHGTQWQDLADTRAEEIFAEVAAAYRRLSQRCDTVVPVGLSMGGALALWVASVMPTAGVVVINPGLRLARGTGLAARMLWRIRPTLSAVAGDIAKPGAVEEAYSVTPVRAVPELDCIFRRVRGVLPMLRNQHVPVLMLRSSRDNVLGSGSAALLRRSLSPGQLQEVLLRRSQHVATLDYDAELVQRRIIQFLRQAVAQ